MFKQEWIDKNIIFVCNLFDCQDIMLSYEHFLCIKSFPVTSKDFNFVIPNEEFNDS